MKQINKINDPFGAFCVSLGCVPSVYDEALTYEEQLLWFLKYLRDTVIPAVQDDQEAVIELQALYVQLEDYVNHYFDNLDVQEEINNKLDDMVEQGTLQEIIASYLNSNALWCFDTVAEMKEASNLIVGSYAKTLGYYEINDGGGATYKIVDSSSNLYHQEELSSNLYANLIITDDKINFRQLGAKPNDNTYDNHSHFMEFESLCNNNDKKLTLYIPAGIWYSSENNFTRVQGLSIIGNSKVMRGREVEKDNTVLKNINDNQNYYFKIGNLDNNSTLVMGYYLDSLVFEGSYENSAILIMGLMYSKIGTLHFRFINKGHCLNISTSWEIDFDFMSFRCLFSRMGALYFDDIYPLTGIASNCSALYFNYLNFESINCSAIETNKKANFVHCEFNIIEYERSFATSGAVSSLPEGVTLDDTYKIYLFKGWFDKTTINSINHNNRNTIYVQDSDNTWITYLALFSDDITTTLHDEYTYNNYHVSLGNLLLTGGGASYIVSSHYAERTSLLTIGMVHQRDMGEKIYYGDGNNGLALIIGNINNTTLQNNQYALNCLMDKMLTNSKSTTTSYKALELMTTDKSLDISGCCLVARYSQPIPCKGVKKINLIVELINSSDNTSESGSMRFGYKSTTDGTINYITNIALTAGINRISIDLSELSYPVQYYIYPLLATAQKLLVYTINYEY